MNITRCYFNGNILKLTNISDWKWVPTKFNDAHDVTKWKSELKIISESRWYLGPDFLYNAKCYCPVEANCCTETEEEIRSQLTPFTA